MQQSITPLRVLIACEESQAECIAFRNLGHEAYSCDIQKCRQGGHPEWHIHSDVLPLLDGLQDFLAQDNTPHHVDTWDLIIAHPPCTYLCKASLPLLKKNGQVDPIRLCKLKMARDFFFRCLHAKALYVAVENPLPMALAQLPKPSCFIQPSWFGVKYTKKTLFWLRNLPPIVTTLEHPNPKSFVSSSRGKYRSRTFPEVAKALASQWSEFIMTDLYKRDLADYPESYM